MIDTSKFKLIKHGSHHHLRNIEICMAVARKDIAAIKKYNLSNNRIREIYRIYMACLCNQLDGTRYSYAIKEKKCYNREDALEILSKYQEFVLNKMLA
jgi:hypothetical protein